MDEFEPLDWMSFMQAWDRVKLCLERLHQLHKDERAEMSALVNGLRKLHNTFEAVDALVTQQNSTFQEVLDMLHNTLKETNDANMDQ